MKVFLRVNGVDIPKARVRNRIEAGSPLGRPEVVIEVPAVGGMPALGEIAIDDDSPVPGLPNFRIEVRGGENEEWKAVAPKELTALLRRYGQEKKR